MYKANISFVTKSYSVREGEVLEDDFTTESEIQEFLNIGYIAEYNGNIAITENGTYDVSNYGTADVEVTTIKLADGMKLARSTNIPSNVKIDTSEVTDMSYFFDQSSFETAPYMNTSKVTTMKNMFNGNSNLKNVPVYDTSSINAGDGFKRTFYALGSQPLTDDSLNNIMQMCINATSYTGTKTLKELGIVSTKATTCQSLSNYQAFLDAGWTTDY